MKSSERICSVQSNLTMYYFLTVLTLTVRICAGQSLLTLHYSIMEELPAGTPVGNVAKDANLSSLITGESDNTPDFLFSFSKTTPHASRFTIEEDSGIIKTGEILDRDSICSESVSEKCELNFDVIVKPVEYFQVIQIVVNIEDQNDNSPVFTDSEITMVIAESQPKDSTFLIPQATDLDSGVHGIQTYRLLTFTDTFQLRVTPVIGGSFNVELMLLKRLDRETSPSYKLKIIALDGGSPPKTGSLQVLISVQDINDNSPAFLNTTYRADIDENIPTNNSVITVRAYDQDTGINGRITYSFSQQTSKLYGHLFGINSESGEIFIRGTVDYEKRTFYHLSVIATDQGFGSQPAQTLVIVNLKDLNDNAPDIVLNVNNNDDIVEVKESDPVGSFVVHIVVTDRDTGRNGEFDCSIDSSDFVLNSLYKTNQFKITLAAELDYELKQRYDIVMTCKDQGRISMKTEKAIRVDVIDENDNVPVFSKQFYQVEVEENNLDGMFICRVFATDADSGENGQVRYSIQSDDSGIFHIDQTSGNITAAAGLDREKNEKVTLLITATDRGSTPKNTSTVVTVTVLDQNDCKPEFTQTMYNFSIYENEPPGFDIGIVGASDADKDISGEFHFSIDKLLGDDLFDIDPVSGKISSRITLDHEVQSAYHVIVRATDHGEPSLSSTAVVTVHVLDKNDNPPVITYPTHMDNILHMSDAAPLDSIATTVHAYDLDEGVNAQLSYSIIHNNEDSAETFKIVPNSGEILVSSDLSEYTHKSLVITILVKDNGFPSHNTSAELNIYVNKSAVMSTDPSTLLSGSNLIIVIAITSVTFVVTVILIVAIIILTVRKKVPRSHMYAQNIIDSQKPESQETLHDSDSSKSSIHIDYEKGTITKYNTKQTGHMHRPHPANCNNHLQTSTNPINHSTKTMPRKKKIPNNKDARFQNGFGTEPHTQVPSDVLHIHLDGSTSSSLDHKSSPSSSSSGRSSMSQSQCSDSPAVIFLQHYNDVQV